MSPVVLVTRRNPALCRSLTSRGGPCLCDGPFVSGSGFVTLHRQSLLTPGLPALCWPGPFWIQEARSRPVPGFPSTAIPFEVNGSSLPIAKGHVAPSSPLDSGSHEPSHSQAEWIAGACSAATFHFQCFIRSALLLYLLSELHLYVRAVGLCRDSPGFNKVVRTSRCDTEELHARGPGRESRVPA